MYDLLLHLNSLGGERTVEIVASYTNMDRMIDAELDTWWECMPGDVGHYTIESYGELKGLLWTVSQDGEADGLVAVHKIGEMHFDVYRVQYHYDEGRNYVRTSVEKTIGGKS